MAEILLARERSLAGSTRHLVIKRVLPDISDNQEMLHMFLDESKLFAPLDPLLGWQVRVATPVVGEDIPGGHSSLLQEPNVRVLAEKMQRHLDAAMSRLAAAAQAAAPSTAASPAQSSHDATPVA